MLTFLNTKAYKKSYFMYLAGLFFICSLAGAFIYRTGHNRIIERYQNQSLMAYEKVETNVNRMTQKADDYIAQIYNDSRLWEDFECFLNNRPEAYMAERLNNSVYYKELVSFTEDLRGYIGINNHFVKKIYIYGDDLTSIITFRDNDGMNIEYDNHPWPYRYSEIASEGQYLYNKTLLDPENSQKVIGRMVFVFNEENIFEQLSAYNFGYGLMRYTDKYFSFGQPMSKKMEECMIEIASIEKVNGAYNLDLLDKFYYNTYTSATNGYRIVMGVDSNLIGRDNKVNNILLLIGTVLIYFFLIGFITMRTERDARYLTRIIDSIQSAKGGNFIRIQENQRQDEYGVIARELNDMSYQLNHYIKNEYLLKIKQKETQMEALLYQINPHFLYNTLEIIKSCAIVNNDHKVADAVSDLGNMYRNMVKEEKIITIERELTLLEYYLKLMEFKYSDQFFYQIDVDSSIFPVETVKFWMQPLVENFFVHGFDSESDFNLMIIKGRAEKLDYVFQIMDNGKGCSKDRMDMINKQLKTVNDKVQSSTTQKTGIGLFNVMSRLDFFHINRVSMELKHNEPQGTIIEIRIVRSL